MYKRKFLEKNYNDVRENEEQSIMKKSINLIHNKGHRKDCNNYMGIRVTISMSELYVLK